MLSQSMACRSVKINNFIQHKIFFFAALFCFCRHEILFCATLTFFVDMEHFFMQHQVVFVNIKLFVSTQNYFSCNDKFLFLTLFRMLFHGDKFLLSRSNKIIITCQKKYIYLPFYVTQKIYFFFVYHKFFIFNVNIAHWQHVDLLRSSLETKKLLIHLLLCPIYGSSYQVIQV